MIRMDAAPTDNRTIHEYLLALRSGSPTPGGGSAAAIAGSLGASLLAMVCRLTLARADSEIVDILQPAVRHLDDLVDSLSRSALADESVYRQYRDASILPKATDQEKQARSQALQSALVAAADAPLESARFGLEATNYGAAVARFGSRHALSDVETGRLLLDGSIQGALAFVEVNVALIKDHSTADIRRRRSADLRHQSSQASKAIWTALAARS
jgi:methenyltetrahydrofolate cyclohydrolase